MILTTALILTLLAFTHAQEWYMPNSRMISPQQFKTYIKEDKSTYKFVKFFTPHCMWCRHLKTVVDQLKQERKWEFEIYDVNCAWYSGLCREEVHAGSFPYSGIYDKEGNLYDQIHGFYPLNVMKNAFEKLDSIVNQEKSSLSAEPSDENMIDSHHPPGQVDPAHLEPESVNPTPVHNEAVQANAQVNTEQTNSRKADSSPKTDQSIAQPRVAHEELIPQSADDSVQSEPKGSNKVDKANEGLQTTPNPLTSQIVHYAFYAVCLVGGLVYFVKFSGFFDSGQDPQPHTIKFQQQSTPHQQKPQQKESLIPQTQSKTEKEEDKGVGQLLDEEL